jgi:hypothetical protein
MSTQQFKTVDVDVAKANVEKVRAKRVWLVRNRLSRGVRKALNDAVKRGELGHLKKDGHKPEAYFHPDFAHLARHERIRTEWSVLAAVQKNTVTVMVGGEEQS